MLGAPMPREEKQQKLLACGILVRKCREIPYQFEIAEREISGMIFGGDKAVVLQIVDGSEYVPEIDLARARLMAARDIREMVLADLLKAIANALDQVSLHNLDVVDIEEQLHVRTAGSLNHLDPIFHGV